MGGGGSQDARIVVEPGVLYEMDTIPTVGKVDLE